MYVNKVYLVLELDVRLMTALLTPQVLQDQVLRLPTAQLAEHCEEAIRSTSNKHKTRGYQLVDIPPMVDIAAISLKLCHHQSDGSEPTVSRASSVTRTRVASKVTSTWRGRPIVRCAEGRRGAPRCGRAP